MDSGKPMELFMETERVSERKTPGAACEERRGVPGQPHEVFLSSRAGGLNSARQGVPKQPRLGVLIPDRTDKEIRMHSRAS